MAGLVHTECHSTGWTLLVKAWLLLRTTEILSRLRLLLRRLVVQCREPQRMLRLRPLRWQRQRQQVIRAVLTAHLLGVRRLHRATCTTATRNLRRRNQQNRIQHAGKAPGHLHRLLPSPPPPLARLLLPRRP